MSHRVAYSKLIVALAEGDRDRVVKVYMEDMGVKTKYMKADIQWRVATFWNDHDSKEVTNGMNIHHFLEWVDKEDPVESLPDEYIMAARTAVLLRGEHSRLAPTHAVQGWALHSGCRSAPPSPGLPLPATC